MRHKLPLLLLLSFAALAHAQSATPSDTAPQLSARQRTEIGAVIGATKVHVKELGELLAKRGKEFDEVLLGEKTDMKADGRAAEAIKAVLNETAQTRLQAARKVVHLLTAEQRRYLKAEMAKPDSQGGILEIAEKIFHIRAEKE